MVAYRYYYYLFQYFLNQEQVIAEGHRINTVEQGKKCNVHFAQLRAVFSMHIILVMSP